MGHPGLALLDVARCKLHVFPSRMHRAALVHYLVAGQGRQRTIPAPRVCNSQSHANPLDRAVAMALVVARCAHGEWFSRADLCMGDARMDWRT